MDSIFEQIQTMRPSSFSEEEQTRYRAEKMMLRQFMLLKHQDQVPDCLSVADMKSWLLTGRSFLDEFQEITNKTNIKHLLMAEQAWTTARHVCLQQMEEELLDELCKEEQLSQLFGRKVTLEGLHMFTSVVRPGAQRDVQSSVQHLHRRLMRVFGGTNIASHLFAADVKPAPFLELDPMTSPLVQMVLDTALRVLLDTPEWEDKIEAASVEIGKLLCNSVAPCLSQSRPISNLFLFNVCTSQARLMVKAISKRFEERSKSFHQMDYDESFFGAREGVISAIQDMEEAVRTPAFSQAHLLLSTSEELDVGIVEEFGASPPVSLEETATAASLCDVNEDTSWAELDNNVPVHSNDELEEKPQEPVKGTDSLVQDCAVQNMDHEVQAAASSQAHVLSTTDGLSKGLVEESEASPAVSVNEELITMQHNVATDTSVVRVETNVTVHMNDELEILDCDDDDEKMGVDVFCGVWKMLSCCFGIFKD